MDLEGLKGILKDLKGFLGISMDLKGLKGFFLFLFLFLIFEVFKGLTLLRFV